MSISIGRGFRQQNSILYPSNMGMGMVAKNRIQQAVGMQNARHIESLKVDGVDLDIWIKQFSGQLCSCGLVENKVDTNLEPLDVSGNNKIIPFSSMSVEENWDNPEVYNDFEKGFNPQNNYTTDELTEDLIAQYAESQNNSLMFGGDKTPCGICYGTGYKNGYRLYNGDRIVLDYFNTPEKFGFVTQKTYPISFESDYRSDNYIIWKFTAPTFFKDFLGIRVRNNVRYCENYSKFISFDNITWQEYNDSLVKQRNGIPTTIYLKIIPYDLELYQKNKFTITHIEVFYQLGEYIKADFSPMSKNENWELFEALQTTNLELAGDAAYLDRECVIAEPKYGNLWKVISLTPHMTSARQIFKTELEMRMVQPSENLYLLNLLKKPYILLNYRGLEQKQDMKTYLGEYK